VARPAEVAPGMLVNMLPNPPLLLPVWIWLLPIVDSGANGGLKGDAGMVAGGGTGSGAATVLEGRPGSPRTARRAGLGWRPSTVTCGMSISVGAFDVVGDPAAVGGAGAACDGAGWAGACPAAAAAGGSAEGTAWGVGGAGSAVCGNAVAWLRQTMASADVPKRANRVARIFFPNPSRYQNNRTA
jgi:hypothetical protein